MVAFFKKLIKKKHDNDQTNLRLRMYLDESNKNDDVTTIVVDAKWAQSKRLESANVALTHYEELEKLIVEVERLAKLCRAKIDEMSKIYKMYLDS